MRKQFSNWHAWEDRNELAGISFPGIYCLAIAQTDLTGEKHTWIKEVCYVGMTISQGGLRSRLAALNRSIKSLTGTGHGGAYRIRYKYPEYRTLVPNLYVSIDYFDFDAGQNTVSSLLQKGDVVKHEYDCFASYMELNGQLPEFNDMKRSPKK